MLCGAVLVAVETRCMSMHELCDPANGLWYRYIIRL